jgi:SAM-dependent methyltransferase
MWARYVSAALALKTIGATGTGRSAYRYLSGHCMTHRHGDLGSGAMTTGLWVWDAIGEALPRGPARVLELGTGWTHFYSLFLRLAYPVQVVLFDVVDNRNLEALRRRFAAVAAYMRQAGMDDERIPEAASLAERISRVPSFEALYRLTGATYAVEESGDFRSVVEPQFDCVMSVDVLEHVAESELDKCIANIARVLNEGGVSAHQIGLNDHLNNYASGMPSKNYLRFSDPVWRCVFENKVQYINRMQAPHYRRLFASHHLAAESESLGCDWRLPKLLQPASRYRQLGMEDLCATRMTVIHRRT